MSKNNILLVIIISTVFASAGFYGGLTYQKSKTPSFSNMRGQFGGQIGNQVNGSQQRRMGSGQTIGEITSVSDTSITVKTTDGSSKLVLVTDKTSINKATSITIKDLVVGQKVAAFGTTNTDGSVTGQNIQLNPTLLQKSERSL